MGRRKHTAPTRSSSRIAHMQSTTSNTEEEGRQDDEANGTEENEAENEVRLSLYLEII